jgi:hypothetical protein
MTTTYPTNPPKDFNEWMQYIHRELHLRRAITLINNREVRIIHDKKLLDEIKKYHWR